MDPQYGGYQRGPAPMMVTGGGMGGSKGMSGSRGMSGSKGMPGSRGMSGGGYAPPKKSAYGQKQFGNPAVINAALID